MPAPMPAFAPVLRPALLVDVGGGDVGEVEGVRVAATVDATTAEFEVVVDVDVDVDEDLVVVAEEPSVKLK